MHAYHSSCRAMRGMRSASRTPPWIGIRRDLETVPIMVSAGNEGALEEALTTLSDTNHVNICVGASQMVYRETLSQPTSIRFPHKRQAGGASAFADITIEFEPLPPGSGFESAGSGRVVSKQFFFAVEKGLAAEKEGGILIA
jgi:elongation factor G